FLHIHQLKEPELLLFVVEKKVNVGTVLGLATRHRAEHVQVFYAKPLQIGFVLLQSAYGFVACHKFHCSKVGHLLPLLSFSSSSSVKDASTPPFLVVRFQPLTGRPARTGANYCRPHSIRRVETQSFRETSTGLIDELAHQASSSPKRWLSRCWVRQSGTVNSPLPFRPSARGWVNRRWWASAGLLPQIRHGGDATNLRWALSRCRRGSLIVSLLLSILAGVAST